MAERITIAESGEPQRWMFWNMTSGFCLQPGNVYAKHGKCAGCYCKCHGLADPIGTGFIPSEANFNVR